MTDLSAILDAAAAEKDRKEWLSARDEGFGCSDLGALWLILGWAGEDVFDWREVETTDANGKPTKRWVSNLYQAAPNGERDYVTPRYLMESAAVMKKTGLPRLIAEKAGLAKPKAQSDAQEEGKHKERALFQQSRLGRFDTQAFYAPDDAHTAPPGWPARSVFDWGDVENGRKPLVLRDSVEPRLLCTVEAWEYAPKGMIAWELKTDRLGLRTKPPWAQRYQAIGQAVVLGADAWGIQYGPEWAKTDAPAFPDLRDVVQWGPFAVNDSDRAMVRQAVKLGWELVERAKETRT